MGAQIIKYLGFLSAVLVFGCTFKVASAGDYVQEAKLGLFVVDQDGYCYLQHRGNSDFRLKLTITPPCYFYTEKGDLPKHYIYEDARIDGVFVVIGGKLSPSIREDWALPGDKSCGNQLQGVILGAGRIKLSRGILQDGVFCRDSGIDEKVFWEFAHE